MPDSFDQENQIMPQNKIIYTRNIENLQVHFSTGWENLLLH